MAISNLYWPVYKNLEKELLKLAECVHFADDQLNVYSMHIADLIVRCAVEIESLSKELYCRLGGLWNQLIVKGIKETYILIQIVWHYWNKDEN